MSGTPRLMVHYRKHYTSKAWGDESWTAAREPSVPEVLAWLQEQNVGEEVEWCKTHNHEAGPQYTHPALLESDECWQQVWSDSYDLQNMCRTETRLVVPLDPKEGV